MYFPVPPEKVPVRPLNEDESIVLGRGCFESRFIRANREALDRRYA